MIESGEERPNPVLDYGRPPPTSGHGPLRRVAARIIGWAAVIVAVVGVLCGVISGNATATPDYLLLAFGLGLVTVFVRYGNVKL